MKKILLVLIFTPIILFGQPKPPSKPSSNPSSNELFGTAQNNIMGAQAKSFGGGSIIKPNPMLTSADIAFKIASLVSRELTVKLIQSFKLNHPFFQMT